MYLLASSLAAALLDGPFEQPENEAERSCDAPGIHTSTVNKLFVNSLLTRATIP